MKTILLCLLLAATAFAQTTTYALSPVPKLQFLDQNGAPYSGGLLYTCVAGSACSPPMPSSPQATYSDDIGTPNSNPIVLDSAGRATVFLNTALTYKFVLQNSLGVTIYTQDTITGNGAGGSAGSSIVTQQITGSMGIPLNQFATDQYIDARSCGIVANNSGFDNAPAINRCLAFAAATAATPGIVLMPPGEYWVGSTILLNNTSMRLIGAGWGNGSEYANPTIGTVLKAMPTFVSTNTGANFYKNYVLAINCNSDCFDVRGEQMTVDGNGYADGLYVGHANEQSGYSYITVDNYLHTGGGLYLCGAGNSPTYSASVCGAINGGDQGDGPYENLQFYPQTNATAASIPIMMVGVLSLKDAGNWTISGTGAATQPSYAGYIGGIGVHLHDIHMEGLQNGFVTGGTTSVLCPSTPVCNGMVALTASNIDLTASSAGASQTFNLYDCQECNFTAIADEASGGKAIYSDFGGSPVTSTDVTVSWLSTRAAGGTYFVLSSDPSWDFHLANTNVVLDHDLQLYNDDSYQLLFKSKTTPFYYMKFFLDPAGTMHVFNDGGNGTGNLSWETPYSWIAMRGNTAIDTSLFMQSPLEAANGYIRAIYGQGIYWNHAAANWQTVTSGGTDYSTWYFPSGGGSCLSTTNGLTANQTLTNGQFIANSPFCIFGQTGNTIIGADAPAQTDDGSALQVDGSLSVLNSWNVGNSREARSSSTSCPTSNVASSTCTFTFTFSPAFPTAPGNASCTLIAPSGSPYIRGVSAPSTTGMTLTVANGQGSDAVASGAAYASCWLTP